MSYIKLNKQDIDIENARKFIDDNDLSRIEIQLQSAPIKEVGINGCQIDEVIEVIFLCKEILESFNKSLPSRETSLAVTKLDEAIMWCAKRTTDRIKRGVEGTNNA